MADLSGAEFKVLMYIVRRTFGFQKDGDTISLRQLVGGITKRDGTRLDYGTGLNKDTVCKALASLEKKGIISKENRHDETGDLPNFYSLNLEAGTPKDPGRGAENPTGGEPENSVSRVGKSDRRGDAKSRHGRVAELDTHLSVIPTLQETPLQQTDLQDTATTEFKAPLAGVAAAAWVESVLKGRVPELQLLEKMGFSAQDALHLTMNHPPEVIRQQVEWLDRRSVRKNRLGMLRRAIEDRWPKPESTAVTTPGIARVVRRQREQSKRLHTLTASDKLRELLARLESEAPGELSEFKRYVDQEKLKLANRPIVRDNPQRLASLMKDYESEEKILELMDAYFKGRTVPFADFASLIR